MDTIECKSAVVEYLKKYRIILVVVLIGAFLMLMPETPKPNADIPAETLPEKADLQTSLGLILSKIEGAGKTEVLLTESAGEQVHYQANEDISTRDQGKDQRRDTVLVTNSDREETGLIRRIDPPTYQGAIVIWQGANTAQVRLSIGEAVANATGLSTNRITVLKMK